MRKNQFIAVFLLVVLLFTFISGCAAVSRIDSFFQNGGYKQHSKIIDFALFFTMFFALCYLGLTKVWGGKGGFGEASAGSKGAIVALCLALSLALSFAIVTQTKFSLTTMFPLAKAIFFLMIWFLLYGLLSHLLSGQNAMGPDWGRKIIAALLALMLTYILFSITTHMLCQMTDNMDDPACRSDFFNFGTTMLGKLFGQDWSISPRQEWQSSSGVTSGGGMGPGGTSGGTSGTTSGGGTGGTGTSGTTTVPTGPFQGKCRLDILFNNGDATPLIGQADIDKYVALAKQNGITKVTVSGFASKRGEPTFNNRVLSNNRAVAIGKMLDAAKMPNSIRANGVTEMFGAESENRRVTIIGDGSNYLPAPSVGSPANCPTKATCDANNKCPDGQECVNSTCVPIGAVCSKDKPCPAGQECKDGKCVPAAGLCSPACVPDREVCDKGHCCPIGSSWNEASQTCRLTDAAGKKKDGAGMGWLKWLLLAAALIGLALLIWALARRKKKVDVKKVFVRKDRYLEEVAKILEKKKKAYGNLMVEEGELDKRDLDKEADHLIAHINEELRTHNLESLEFVIKKHAKDKPEVIDQSLTVFEIPEQDRKVIITIIEALRKEKDPEGKDAFPANAKHDKIRNIVKEDVMHGKKLGKEYHEFFKLQLQLKKETKDFMDDEYKTKVKIEQSHAKGFMWRKPKKEDHLVVPKPDQGIVNVTQAVVNVCEEIIHKVDEIVALEHRVTDEPSSRVLGTNLQKLFTEEEMLIHNKLIPEVKKQKQEMGEDWQPVIEKVDSTDKKAKGKIHSLGSYEFIYVWWMFDNREQFNHAATIKMSPSSIRQGKPIQGEKEAKGNVEFEVESVELEMLPNDGKIVALGACRKDSNADGHWKWDNEQLRMYGPVDKSKIELVLHDSSMGEAELTGQGLIKVDDKKWTIPYGTGMKINALPKSGFSFQKIKITIESIEGRKKVLDNQPNACTFSPEAVNVIEVFFKPGAVEETDVLIHFQGSDGKPKPHAHFKRKRDAKIGIPKVEAPEGFDFKKEVTRISTAKDGTKKKTIIKQLPPFELSDPGVREDLILHLDQVYSQIRILIDPEQGKCSDPGRPKVGENIVLQLTPNEGYVPHKVMRKTFAKSAFTDDADHEIIQEIDIENDGKVIIKNLSTVEELAIHFKPVEKTPDVMIVPTEKKLPIKVPANTVMAHPNTPRRGKPSLSMKIARLRTYQNHLIAVEIHRNDGKAVDLKEWNVGIAFEPSKGASVEGGVYPAVTDVYESNGLGHSHLMFTYITPKGSVPGEVYRITYTAFVAQKSGSALVRGPMVAQGHLDIEIV